MPKKHGWEVLQEIKNNLQFKNIPIIVLTTSHDIEDINYSYQLGCNAFITKPTSWDVLVAILKNFGDFWCQTTRLPSK